MPRHFVVLPVGNTQRSRGAVHRPIVSVHCAFLFGVATDCRLTLMLFCYAAIGDGMYDSVFLMP